MVSDVYILFNLYHISILYLKYYHERRWKTRGDQDAFLDQLKNRHMLVLKALSARDMITLCYYTSCLGYLPNSITTNS